MPVGSTGTLTARDAAAAWREFAGSLKVVAPNGKTLTWTEYLTRYGDRKPDERKLVGPVAFPMFAARLLGFDVGKTLHAELSGKEGRPDFTPADAVTHPFVFEAKGTEAGLALSGHDEQVGRYLREGRSRIKRVVLTNLYGLRVFALAADGHAVQQTVSVDLYALVAIPGLSDAAARPDAQALADFLNTHRYRALDGPQKIDRVRQAPPWNPGLEVTDTDWVLRRLAEVVESVRQDVILKVRGLDQLRDPTLVPAEDQALIERELRELDKRVGSTDAAADARDLDAYLKAGERTKDWRQNNLGF